MKSFIAFLLCCGTLHLVCNVEAVSEMHAGSVDESFRPGGAHDGLIRCLLPLADGRLLVGGDFRLWDGLTVPSVVRLNHDGSLDPNFRPQLSFLGFTGVS